MTSLTKQLERTMNNVPCTLAVLQAAFPRKPGNCGRTGYIPMAFFEANEPEIRKVMHEHKLRAIYRGPRISNVLKNRLTKASMTRRCDAEFVVLYVK